MLKLHEKEKLFLLLAGSFFSLGLGLALLGVLHSTGHGLLLSESWCEEGDLNYLVSDLIPPPNIDHLDTTPRQTQAQSDLTV